MDGKQTKQTEVVGICGIVFLFSLAKEGLTPRPEYSGEEIESQKKHICQSHSETNPPSCSMKVCQQSPPSLPPPSVYGVKAKDEGDMKV